MAQDLQTLTNKFRSLGDSHKCKQLCNLSAAELTDRLGVQFLDNSFSIDIIFQQPLTIAEINAFWTSNANLFDLAPGVQTVVTSNARGGKIVVSVPQNNLRSKIVDCPTLITALCLSVDVPTSLGTVEGTLYPKDRLSANAADGVSFPDQSVNPGVGVPANLDTGVSAFLALKPFLDAFTAELSLGCDYVITTQALNRIGAKINSIVTGASSSEGDPREAITTFNRNSESDYFTAAKPTETCGDCCAQNGLEHKNYKQTVASESYEGQYSGCYPIPICLMVFPDTSVGFSLLLNNDTTSYDQFTKLLGDDESEFLEGRSEDAYRTQSRSMTRHDEQGNVTLRVGKNPCFRADQASNPEDTFTEVVVPPNTDTWLPCDASGAKNEPGGAIKTVSRYGIQQIAGGAVVGSLAAGDEMVSFGNLDTMQNRESRIELGVVEPKTLKVGTFRFKIDFVGARISASAAYMLMYNVFGCPVDGDADYRRNKGRDDDAAAASAIGGLPEMSSSVVDRKMLLEAYMTHGGQIDKYLRNPFVNKKGHPLAARGNSLAGLLGMGE